MNTKHTCVSVQSLVADESFQHILRVLNTNVDGKQKIMFAMTAIRGIGRRFSNLACKKAEVDMRKRRGSASSVAGSVSVATHPSTAPERVHPSNACQQGHRMGMRTIDAMPLKIGMYLQGWRAVSSRAGTAHAHRGQPAHIQDP